jgi:PAS domain S-box-containing protein
VSVKPDYEALFQACPYPFVLLDTSLTIVGANDAYLRTTGAAAHDIVGRYAFSAFPPDPSECGAIGMAVLRDSVLCIIATRRPHNAPLVRYALRRDGPDGPHYEERYWSVMHTPVLDKRGDVMYVVQNAIDVTDACVPNHDGLAGDGSMGGFNRALMDEAMIRALSDETSHLRNLFWQAPGFVAVLKGRECVFEMVNEAYQQMVGHRDIVGKPLLEALPELAGQVFDQLLAQVFETGKPFVGRGVRATIQRVPGGPVCEIYVDFVYQPIVAQDGAVTAIFVQGHEVTEAINAQMEKQAADERLRHGLETARMAVWDWDLASGSVAYVHNMEMVLGRRWSEVDQVSEAAHPEDIDAIRAAIEQALATKSNYSVEHRFIRPDTGETIWVNSRGQLLCDAEGNPSAFRGVTLDISERKRAEIELERVNRALAERVRELAEAERRQAFQLEVSDRLRRIDDPAAAYKEVCQLLRRFLDVSRVVCGEYDPQRALVTFHSNYTDGTAGELAGAYPVEAFGVANFESFAAGQTWVSDDMEHDPRTGRPDIWPNFVAAGIRSGLVVPLNLRGLLVPCLFVHHCVPRRWSTEEVRLVEDISERLWNAVERVRAEQALRQADQRKDEFLAMLAHELRNPLAPISAAAELLRVGTLDSDSIRKTSQVIGRQVGHMTGLVNDLLDVSRVTRGLVELERRLLDMKRVVADALEQVGPLIQARGHRLAVRTGPATPTVEGDHKRLVQVLANLLANAAKYTPQAGTIGLDLDMAGDMAVIRVSDDGIGIPQEVLPHVFDLFSQAQRTPDRSQGGLGLGLALVRSLVELHGGTVGAYSEGQGKGSEFIVRLPCTVSVQAPVIRREEIPAVLPFSRTLRLMVVDDNADAAHMLQLLLEGSGHDVVVENDALAALDRARREQFDAFLLDIGLPRMEGRELARRLRHSDANSSAVLVAVTGYGQQCDRVSALESGFDHYFVKPVDAERLLEVLEGAPAHSV